VRICGRGLPTHQIRWKSEKLFVDVRTDVRTHLSSNLLSHRRGDDLKIKTNSYTQALASDRGNFWHLTYMRTTTIWKYNCQCTLI